MGMTVSELIKWLEDLLEKEGDLKVYVHDMKDPELELCETLEPGDYKVYGKKYVFIEERG